MTLTRTDLEVLAADLPGMLRRFAVCRRVIEVGLFVDLEELAQQVLVVMLDREARGLKGYDGTRAGLALYAELTAKSVALQALRAQRAERRTPPAYTPPARHEPPRTPLRLTEAERAWLDAYVAEGEFRRATRRSPLTNREAAALVERLRTHA